MNIEILNVLDKKDLKHERVVLSVKEDCNCWPFIILSNKQTYAGYKAVFVFPNMEVYKGDMITVYTKKGVTQKQKMPNGYVNHILYWGEDASVWNDDMQQILLLEVRDYEYKTF